MIQIELKGFLQSNTHNFTGIAPMRAHDHSRGYGEYPANHHRFEGRVAGVHEDVSFDNWNPETVFSDESWVEVDLYLLCFRKTSGIWFLDRRIWLGEES